MVLATGGESGHKQGFPHLGQSREHRALSASSPVPGHPQAGHKNPAHAGHHREHSERDQAADPAVHCL